MKLVVPVMTVLVVAVIAARVAINAASLVAAGMLSVLIFPAAALALLRREERRTGIAAFPDPTPEPEGGLP
jgi:hypothetical protein